ncbi:MAG: T9SS type A sorting domain-containing protein [Bacteroidota bacterium]
MKKILLLIILLIITCVIQSQTIRFNRMYHVANPNSGVGTRFNQIVLQNNKYITFGHYDFRSPGSSHEYTCTVASKHDSLGNLISWIPYIDTAFNTGLTGWSSDVKTVDGGYIVSGFSCENISPYTYYGFLMKLDSNLNMQWQRHYIDTAIGSAWMYPDYGFQALKVTPDKGYIVVGIRYKNGGNSCGLAIKYDSLGNQQWLKTYNLNYYWSAYNSVIILPDGYVFAGGICVTSDFNTNDDIITKVDSAGNVIWQKTLGGIKGGEWIGLQNHPDNSIMALMTKCDSAYTDQYGDYYNFLKLQFYKLSSATGDTTWSSSYGPTLPNNISYSFRVLPDGSALASGSYNYLEIPWLLHLNIEGTVDWYKEYNMAKPYNTNHFSATPFDIQQTLDNGFVVCGQIVNTDTINGNCGWILKIDEHGCLLPNCDTITGISSYINIASSLEIFPNPASTSVTVKYFSDIEQGKLEIYNTMGIKAMQIQLPKGQNTYNFSVSQLPKGFYKVILKDKSYIRGQVPLVIVN